MMIPTRTRSVSLILKCAVIISAVIGVISSAIAGREVFMGGKSVWMFFTIQSNIAIALVCAWGAVLLMRKKEIGNAWFVFKFVMSISISLTGFVFCFMLAPTLGAAAWNVQNTLTHVIVPVAAVADFFVICPYGNIRTRSVWLVTIPPILYVVYAAVGYVRGWQFTLGLNYPYFFLNWGSPAGAFGIIKEFPYLGCMWWIVILAAFLILLGLLYLVIIRAIGKRLRRHGA